MKNHVIRVLIFSLVIVCHVFAHAERAVECINISEREFTIRDKSCEDSTCGFLLLAPEAIDKNALTGISLIVGSEEKPIVIAPLSYTPDKNNFVQVGFFLEEKYLPVLKVTAHYGIVNDCQLRVVLNGS